ncbi:hypothetical protein QR680_012752 [Steinernema hermaphroditum]|uniref:26S proteasome non-ATPase regulatory subunit 5 n=1 Tax=Steinernema hermaphroditum TaxID=289476 RepID=A0AA39I4F2_9BILA|nr:hypothetical protein QR680_012752 [Steinernema hermaphroditum]
MASTTSNLRGPLANHGFNLARSDRRNPSTMDPQTQMALDELQKLIDESRGSDSVDEGTWPLTRQNILGMLDQIPLEIMFTLNHSILWDAVSVCPLKIVDFIVDEYFMRDKKLSQEHLRTTASAVSIALIRRLTHECSENIAKLLAPAIQNSNVREELIHHLKGGVANRAAHRLGYIDIILAAFVEIDNLDFNLVHEPMDIVMGYFMEQGDDPLLKMAILSTMETTISKTPLFVKYLDSSGYLERLLVMLDRAKTNPDGGSDYNDLLYFFACLAASGPEYIPQFTPFLEGIFDKIVMFDCLDARERVDVFHKLFTCVASSEAKREMNKIFVGGRHFMRTAMQKVCVNVVSLNVVQRLVLLQGLKMAFSNAEPQDSDILEEWFNSFDEGMVAVLVGFMKTIEADQSVAAMELAEVVNGFMDFLLDRSIKFEKSDAMQQKYDLVKQIASTKSPVLDQMQQAQLEHYVAQGVYYSARPAPEVDLLDG